MANFSSYVTIQLSKLVPPLTLTSAQANSGSYDPQPPQTIEPGSTANFQLHDPSGPYGSDGSVAYTGQGVSLSAAYACPYWSSNTGNVATGGTVGFVADWYAQSDDGYWTRQQVPGRGHPLQIFIAVRAASEPVVGPPG